MNSNFNRILSVISMFTLPLWWFVNLWYYKLFKTATFQFNGKEYKYEYHYPKTWFNERCVELPIIWDLVKKQNSNNVLEVGNVLSHYYPVSHDILDKYEVAKGVINQDIVGFDSGKKYNLIVSISTLEHIGWDEKPREKWKALQALESMERLLTENGTVVITIPIGYNNELDELIRTDKIKFDETYYLKRLSKDNRWKQVNKQELARTKYGTPYPRGNGIIVGKISKTVVGRALE